MSITFDSSNTSGNGVLGNKRYAVDLEQWRIWAGINPLAYYDWSIGSCFDGEYPIPEVTYVQDNTITQMHESVISLAQIVRALQTAEAMVSAALDLPLLPVNETEEIPVPRYHNAEYGRVYDPAVTVFTASHRGIRRGQLVQSLELTAIPVVYTDLDGDGISEHATITTVLPSPELFDGDVRNLAIVESGSEATYNSIMPLESFRSVNYDSVTGALTITMDSWGMKQYALRGIRSFRRTWATDYCNTNGLLSDVDIYVTTLDTCDTTSEFVWHLPNTVTPSTPDINTTAPLYIAPVDAVRGTFRVLPAELDTTTGCYLPTGCTEWAGCWGEGRMPDSIVVSYVHGVDMIRRHPQLKDAICQLAASLLPVSYCRYLTILERWQFDTSITVSGARNPTSRSTIPASMQINPFGVTNGAISAWQIVSNILSEYSDHQLLGPMK